MTHTLTSMQRYLTTSQKDRLKPSILRRDGPNCFYCNRAFVLNDRQLKPTFDHLDDNPFNNELHNLVLCHWTCNQVKKESPEYKLMAQDKIKENVDSVGVSVHLEPEPKTTSKEIDIHVMMGKLTKEFLDERLLKQNKPALDFNDTANSIALLMFNQTGHGSPETAKRHLKMFCSSVGQFKIQEEMGEWVIVKRT